jgi:hypothetical protein
MPQRPADAGRPDPGQRPGHQPEGGKLGQQRPRSWRLRAPRVRRMASSFSRSSWVAWSAPRSTTTPPPPQSRTRTAPRRSAARPCPGSARSPPPRRSP